MVRAMVRVVVRAMVRVVTGAMVRVVVRAMVRVVTGVMTHGVEKYGEGSYRKVDPKRYRAALMRHICKYLKNPYGKDSDSGLPHLWHIACNVAFLLELDKESELHFELDGRPLADRMNDAIERLLQSVNGTKKER